MGYDTPDQSGQLDDDHHHLGPRELMSVDAAHSETALYEFEGRSYLILTQYYRRRVSAVSTYKVIVRIDDPADSDKPLPPLS